MTLMKRICERKEGQLSEERERKKGKKTYLHRVKRVGETEGGREGDEGESGDSGRELEAEEVLDIDEDTCETVDRATSGAKRRKVVSTRSGVQERRKEGEDAPLPSSTAGNSVAKLSSTRMRSAASFATSVPPRPIETPMSAILSAGASLTAGRQVVPFPSVPFPKSRRRKRREGKEKETSTHLHLPSSPPPLPYSDKPQ